jgi:hypothetical protein
MERVGTVSNYHNFLEAAGVTILFGGYANLALRDVRLTSASPYPNAGTDGKDKEPTHAPCTR